MSQPKLLILIATLLPPQSLNILGEFVEERTVQTAYGDVGPLALRSVDDDGTNDASSVWVQPYAGLPTRTDPRATILAAQALGIDYILNWDMGIAVNSVLQLGQPFIVTDYIDWTRYQPSTFTQRDGGTGAGAEINIKPTGTATSHQPPFCPRMSTALRNLLPQAPYGTYLGVDGPRQATVAEARMFRHWGVDVMGYNLVPEVVLAQELGLRYAGLVTIGGRSNQLTTAFEEEAIRQSLGRTLNVLPQLIKSLED